jgi:protein O-mannosyl-transferase
MRFNKLYFFVLFVGVALTLLIYFPGLSGIMMLDDGPQLMPLTDDITAENWRSHFKQHLLSNSGHLSRPISMATFIFNAALSGNNLWYWKLTNVIFHGLTGIAVFFCTRSLLSFSKELSYEKQLYISLGISLLWLVHPLHISTVLYVVQRMTILATLFIFIALTCFIYGIKKECQMENGTYFLLSAIFIFFPLALLSKESGALFPVYALLTNQYLRYQEDYKHHVYNRLKPFVAFLWFIIFIGAIAFFYKFDTYVSQGYRFREFTLAERLLTESRVIFLYLYQIIAPLPSSMGFYHDDIQLSRSLLDPISTSFSIIAIILFISVLIIKFKKLGLFSFGLLFFFCSHLIESTILPLEIAFEHRNYIGIWGIILAAVSALSHFTSKHLYIVVALAFILAGQTLYLSSIWGDTNRMYPYMIAAHPQSLRVKIIFADAYTQAGKYEEALEFLKNEPSLGASLHQLCIICEKSKKITKNAILNTVNNKNSKVGTYEMEGIIKLANLGLDKKCQFEYTEFIQFLDSVFTLPIVDKLAEQKLLLYVAHYQHALGQIDNSLHTLEQSFSKDKTNPIPLFLKIDWLIENRRYPEAEEVFLTAKQIAMHSWQDYNEFINRAESSLNQKDTKINGNSKHP